MGVPIDSGACGYCKAVLDSAAAVATCSICGTTQHRECWDEYGGCVMPGCAGYDLGRPAPSPGGASVAVDSSPKGSVIATNPPSKGTGVLVAAAAVMAIAVLGIGGFLLVRSTGSGGQDTYASPGAEPASSSEPEDDPDPIEEEPNQLSGKAKTRAALKALMKKVHRPINYGDWSKSFNYLSSEKQSSKGSPAGWESAYRNSWSSSAELEVESLKVSKVRTTSSGGSREAEFTLSIPLTNGNCYNGTTWAVSEGGRWRFEPGYENHPERQGAIEMKERPGSC